MSKTIHQKGTIEVEKTTTRDKFDKFKDESKKQTREVNVENNPVLQKIRKVWVLGDERWGKQKECDWNWDSNTTYERALELVRNLECTADDIWDFSFLLSEFGDYDSGFGNKAGSFLSALINCGEENDYKIAIEHLGQRIKNLGNSNTKNIILIGDVDANVGLKMAAGLIIVRGNVMDSGGPWGVGPEMKGGKIIIEGDCRPPLGFASDSTRYIDPMEGGVIEVKGDANGYIIGEEMRGGEIIVWGEAKGLTGKKMKNGTITLKKNVYRSVGDEMEDGEINVDGDVIYNSDLCAEWSDSGYVGLGMRGGKITVKGNVELGVGGGMEGGEITVEGNAYDVGNVNSHFLGESYPMEGGRILIKGNAFDVGFEMEGGTIMVEGHAEFGVGMGMKGGTIIIHGNADFELDDSDTSHVGEEMIGGKIIIHGYAGRLIGQNMEGGEIHINGDFESLGDIKGGKIFHKGELIVDK